MVFKKTFSNGYTLEFSPPDKKPSSSYVPVFRWSPVPDVRVFEKLATTWNSRLVFVFSRRAVYAFPPGGKGYLIHPMLRREILLHTDTGIVSDAK